MKKARKSVTNAVVIMMVAIIAIVIIITILPFIAIPAIIIGVGLLLYKFIPKLYINAYFKSDKFLALKESIQSYIAECNELNRHIRDLRNSFSGFRKKDEIQVTYSNRSAHNYKKTALQNDESSNNVYRCSKFICDGAKREPFKYLCKYFNIEQSEETLEYLEETLNNFSAAEDGKELSRKKRDEILENISTSVPKYIKEKCKDRLISELGFDEFQFDSLYFPVYSFRYVSEGGYSSNQFDIEMNLHNLESFISQLAEAIDFKKSAQYQRQLMTPRLRRYIIDRDHNTCKNCGNSTMNEPNLLLEVDHIIPVSKGGITSEENLQTLCWKCNRSKGAKI